MAGPHRPPPTAALTATAPRASGAPPSSSSPNTSAFLPGADEDVELALDFRVGDRDAVRFEPGLAEQAQPVGAGEQPFDVAIVRHVHATVGLAQDEGIKSTT